MDAAFLRREWGAVTFVVTVIVGIVVVPLALYFANVGPGPLTVPPSNTATSAATGARVATSANTTSPTPSKSP